MNYRDKFSERFSALRQEKSISLRGLAVKLSVTDEAIRLLGKGSRSPSFELLCALADFFDVSLDYLCGRSDAPAPALTERPSRGIVEAERVIVVNNEEKILSTLEQIVQRLDQIESKVDSGFRDTRSEIVDVVEAVGRKVSGLEQTIRDVENVTAQNAFDVQLIKRRA